MRIKDEYKQLALYKATIKIVNDIGFASSSVSKIAKEAGVSPATVYIYFKNKEDLLVSTYIDVKKELSKAMLRNFDKDLPIRDILRTIWFNMFDYILKHTDRFQFTEQFFNSPYFSLLNKEEIEHYYDPLFKVVSRGIEQKIIKDVSFEILRAFVFFPILVLSNPSLSPDFRLNDENINAAFTLAWDAIKL